MQIGDVIRRKDMPDVQYKIFGETKDGDFWKAELYGYPYPGLLKKGLVAKGDDRWEVADGQ